MFGSKKKESAAPAAEAKGKEEVKKTFKPDVDVSKLSPRDAIAYKIEQLGEGQALRYQLVEKYGGGFAAISLNPKYPEKKQHKWLLVWGTEKDVTADGKERLAWSSDKVKELATWVLERQGEQIA